MAKFAHASVGASLTQAEFESLTLHTGDELDLGADVTLSRLAANRLGIGGERLQGALGASAWVVASDAPVAIKSYATALQAAGYPAWVCDGVADNVEIQAAIDALPAAGGKVQLSEGTFSGSVAIIPKNGLRLLGTGQALTLIDWTTSFYNWSSSGADLIDIEVGDMTIDLTDVSALARGIFVARGRRIHLHDLKVTEASDAALGTTAINGIQIGNWQYPALGITDVTIDRVISTGRGKHFNFFPLTLVGVTRGHINGSIFHARDSDIVINPAKAPSAQIYQGTQITFTENIFEYGHHNGVFFNDSVAEGSSSSDIKFTSNSFLFNGDDALDINENDFYISVTDNYFLGNEYYDVSIAASSNIQIMGNTFRQDSITALGGLGIGIGGSSNRIVVLGNIQIRTTNARQLVLIYNGTNDNIVISGNIGYNAQKGVWISGGTIKNLIITNNIFQIQEYLYPIVLIEAAATVLSATIADNIIDSVPAQQVRIAQINSTTSYDFLITGNIKGSTGTSGIIGYGAGVDPTTQRFLVRMNPSHKTENSGTATVPSGATTVVITHGLATTPTRVLLTARIWSNASKAWVTTLTATQFTINVDADPGAGTAIFDWRAQVGEG